jgi:sulfatase modifying factor 1
MQRLACLVFVLMLAAAGRAAEMDVFVDVPGGEFRSVIPEGDSDKFVTVADFTLQDAPVTNADFLKFVLYHPEWQRGTAVSLFVDDQYLSSWAGPISLGRENRAQQPVTQVSWFAANAYCESQDARLPSWYEWEFAAAANATQADARELPAWRQRILSWYSTSGGRPLADVRSEAANYYEVFDIHTLIWEWVDDFNALLVSGDNREQGGADQLQFCGAGAISMEEKENYAVLMRVAMLSSLESRYTTRSLGFRCARDAGSSHE